MESPNINSNYNTWHPNARYGHISQTRRDLMETHLNSSAQNAKAPAVIVNDKTASVRISDCHRVEFDLDQLADAEKVK